MLYFGSTKETNMEQHVITEKWYTQTVAKMEKSKSQNSGILQHILKIYLIQKGIKYLDISFRKSGNIIACSHLHQWVPTLTKKINQGEGPYVFRINGQVHHQIGSLLPLPNTSPKFLEQK